MGKTKIFFATDIHGSEVVFRKLLNCWKYYDVKHIVVGGDLTGKMVVPIVEKGGKYVGSVYGIQVEAKGEEELQKLRRRIRDMGAYPYVTDEEGKRKLSEDPLEIERVFERLALEGLEEWMKLATERLANTNVKLYFTGGNDDPYSVSDVLRKYSSDNLVMAEEILVELEGRYEMISLGYSNKTPWNLPRDLSEEELEEKINELVSQVRNMKMAIFNFHVPPYDTHPLDYAPELDENLRPKLGYGGQFKMIPVGSKAVRKSIEVNQPLLGLHGHIHEGKGAAFIKRTLCLNPGSEYGEGILKGVIVELDGDKKPNYFFTSG